MSNSRPCFFTRSKLDDFIKDNVKFLLDDNYIMYLLDNGHILYKLYRNGTLLTNPSNKLMNSFVNQIYWKNMEHYNDIKFLFPVEIIEDENDVIAILG
jgi:hypothetical protein